MIHRDLKPANIKVRRDGTVKVLDFGLAKALSPAAGAGAVPTAMATEAGLVMGTPAYMSPEQARGETAGPQADIWAFGVVLYELLTGMSPFVRHTTADTLASVLGAPPDYALLPPAYTQPCAASDPPVPRKGSQAPVAAHGRRAHRARRGAEHSESNHIRIPSLIPCWAGERDPGCSGSQPPLSCASPSALSSPGRHDSQDARLFRHRDAADHASGVAGAFAGRPNARVSSPAPRESLGCGFGNGATLSLAFSPEPKTLLFRSGLRTTARLRSPSRAI